MKFKRILAISLAAAAFVFASCTKEDVKTGVDASKPGVTDLAYDDINSSKDALAFTWDASEAIAAGATSFTVQLMKTVDGSDATNYDNKLSQTVQVTDSPNDAVIISGHSAGQKYTVRARANYPRSVYSDWFWLQNGSEVAVVKVGAGVVNESLNAPSILSTEPTDKSIKVVWDEIAGAKSYTVEYKKASDSNWSSLEASGKSATIQNLEEGTDYQIRVCVTGTTEYSTVVNVTTLVPVGLRKEISTGAQLVEWLSLVDATASDTYKLVADIDLKGLAVEPGKAFFGTFDGQGHSIKNWNSATPLFETNSGTIKNIVIDASCSFNVTDLIFGTIARDNQGTISGCTNNAAVKFTTDDTFELVLVAGIAGQSKGNITDCANNGAVSVVSAQGLAGAAAAGIAGYQAGKVSGCTNKGDITLTALYTNDKTDIKLYEVNLKDTQVPTIGGIVGYGGDGMSIETSKNYGVITYTHSQINNNPKKANLNRHQIGGIIGSSNGDITDCHNYGEIVATVKTSDGATYSDYDYIVGVGGITGGDYYGKGQDATNITNCSNEAAITVDCDASKSNSTVGGIVGWPGVENNTATTKVSNCNNSGDITVKGTAKVRIGGIEGGSGNIEGCTNTSKITVESAISSSVVGGLVGFHTQTHSFLNNTVKGVTIKVDCPMAGVGGLIAGMGNYAHKVTGCKVDCNITSKDDTFAYTGIVIGTFGGANANEIGTSDSPVKVKGSINGIVLDASNYASYLNGTNKFNAGAHVIIAEYGE